jgi:hypothetical protein
MGLPALRLVLVCAVVTGAGYGAVPADPLAVGDSPATTVAELPTTVAEPPTDRLTVEGDPGGVDAHRTYRRLQGLYDRDLPALSARFRRTGGVELRETHPDPLFGLLADPSIRIDRPVRGAASDGRASVSYRNGTPPGVVERVLVHELAHALEPPALHEEMETAAGDDADTTDATLAREAVAEGAAVFVADAYAERYLDVPTQSARLVAEWSTMTDATRLLWAPYRYGADHIHTRVSSAAYLAVVYADPPFTTERVLHPFRTAVEPRPLAVESEGVPGGERASTDTKGELYLRVLLASELPRERAARAAAGWGTDRLLTYEGDDAAFAWVLRWDGPRDASQFEAAMTDYLNATATRRADGWSNGDAAFRLGRVSGETSYVLAGDPAFVRSVRVTGNDSAVTVAGWPDHTPHRVASARPPTIRSLTAGSRTIPAGTAAPTANSAGVGTPIVSAT